MQVGAQRSESSLTPLGQFTWHSRAVWESREGSGPGADAEPQLAPSCGLPCRLLAMLSHLYLPVQDSPPRRHAPISLGLPAAGGWGSLV